MTSVIDRLRRPVLAGLAAIAMAASLGAADAADQPRRGGSMVLGVDGSGISSLNTQLTSNSIALLIADIWADGLIARDRKGKLVPHLATSWKISEDGLSYTFNLRPGVKWSDGQPFTSADVAFTMNSVAKFNTYQTNILPNVEAVDTPDDKTVVIRLKKPFAPMLDAFDKEIFPIVPKHVYGDADVPTHPANRMPVGLGPYKLKSWEQGRAMTFVRNEYFWDQPKPYLDEVIVALIPDPQQQVNAILRGEIDFMVVPLAQAKRLQEAQKSANIVLATKELTAPERASVDFNMRRPPLDNVKVRQALFTAIDRKRIASDTYFGFARLATNAIPDEFAELTDPSVDYGKLYAFDLKKAGELLDQAGFPMVNGKRFEVEFTYSSSPKDKPVYEPTAQIIASNWKEIGVEVKFAGMEQQLWLDKVYKQNNFDISMISLTGRTDPVFGVDRSFVCNPGKLPYVNPTGYCNPELDEIARQAAVAPTKDRRPLYKKYAEIVARDLNELSLTSVPLIYAVSNKLMNLEAQMDVSFNEHPNWAEVWIKP